MTMTKHRWSHMTMTKHDQESIMAHVETLSPVAIQCLAGLELYELTRLMCYRLAVQAEFYTDKTGGDAMSN